MKAATRFVSSLDGGTVVAVTVLVAIGIVMLYSTTAPLASSWLPPHFVRQLAAVAVALLAMTAALLVPTPWWRRSAPLLWGLSVGLLLLTAWVGVEVKGARRWLPLPGLGLSFQPGELAKWATLLAVAASLADPRERRRLSPRQLVRPLVLFAVPATLLLAQPDLGSVVVLAVLVGLLVFVAGAPARLFVLPAIAGSAAIGLYLALNGYARRRITGFLDPWQTASDEGFQLVQSFVAFGNGGLLGRGIGDGRQKLFYLPEAHTDFILSNVAEEAGLLGVLFVLGAFAALLVSGVRIAARTGDRFALLAAFAMTALLTLPAAVNAPVVMGLLPTKGLTLPFLSYGGTSLVVCFVAVGILLGIGRHGSGAGRPPRPRARRART